MTLRLTVLLVQSRERSVKLLQFSLERGAGKLIKFILAIAVLVETIMALLA